MAERPRVIDFVADLSLSEQCCAFNVMAHQGKHRQCDDYARERIENWGFCKRHAKVVIKAIEEHEK